MRAQRKKAGKASAPLRSTRRTAIERAHIERYLELTERAIKKIRIAPSERSHLLRVAQDFLEMAQAYAGDARHFYERGDFVNALSCVNYAHGWLDAGARLGLFDVGGDDRL